jgi:hypothetical protein
MRYSARSRRKFHQYMKNKCLLIASVLILLLSSTPNASAQWEATNWPYSTDSSNNIPDSCFSFASLNGSIFVTSWAGLFESKDTGLSWSIIDSNFHGAIVSYGNNLIASADGIFLSSNYGESWTPINSELPFIRNRNGTVYNTPSQILSSQGILFAVYPGIGIYRSSDTGTTWLPLDSLPIDQYIINGQFDTVPYSGYMTSSSNKLFIYNPYNLNYNHYNWPYVSTNEGATWEYFSLPDTLHDTLGFAEGWGSAPLPIVA